MQTAVNGFGGARAVFCGVRQPRPLALGRARSVKIMHCLKETAEYPKLHHELKHWDDAISISLSRRSQ